MVEFASENLNYIMHYCVTFRNLKQLWIQMRMGSGPDTPSVHLSERIKRC